MKFFLAYLCLAIFIISPGLGLSADDTGNVMVESIRFMGERDGGDIIHFKLNRKLDPKVLDLPGENPRVVFDFLEAGYSTKEKRVFKVGGRFVKRIRVGMHQQPVAKTRIVIDLTSDKDFEVDKEFIESEKILEVKVFMKTPGVEKKPAVAQLESNKEKTFQSQKAADDPVKDTASITSAQVVDRVKKARGEIVVEDEQAEMTAAKKDTAEVGHSPEMLEELVVTNQVANSNTTDIASADEQPVLINVSYEDTTNNKEMVLFKLSGFHPPVVFAIEEEEPRIVCDFLDVQLGANTKQVLNSKGEYIRRVRVAKHNNPDKVRVVLDLVANNDYDLKQVFFKEDNLFVVIISTL